MNGLRPAATVTGNIPVKVWPDAENAMMYRREINATCGPSGVGKSQITLKRAAMLSHVGPVIYCNAEDDLVIQRFRFELSGANMDNVHFGEFKIPSQLGDLEAAVNVVGAILVVFDTAMDHIEGPLQQWGRPLKALREVLQRSTSECMVDLVHHTNKNVKKSANWRAAIGGATAGLIGTSRSIQLVGMRPGQSDQVVLCPVKDSYAAEPLAVAFEFEREEITQADGEDVEVSFMSLAEKSIKVADPTLLVHVAGDGGGKRGPNPEQAAAAMEFLTAVLAEGARPVKDCYQCTANPDSTDPTGADKSRKCGYLSVYEVEKSSGSCPDCGANVREVVGIHSLAEDEEVSRGTLKRAKAALEVESGAKGFSKSKVGFWTLPDGHPSLDENADRVKMIDDGNGGKHPSALPLP